MRPYVIKNEEGRYLKLYGDHAWSYFDELRNAEIFYSKGQAEAQMKRFDDYYDFHYGHDKVQRAEKTLMLSKFEIVEIVIEEATGERPASKEDFEIFIEWASYIEGDLGIPFKDKFYPDFRTFQEFSYFARKIKSGENTNTEKFTEEYMKANGYGGAWYE